MKPKIHWPVSRFMTGTKHLSQAAIFTLALSAAAPVVAQEAGGTIVEVGPGAVFSPAFPGADKLELGFEPLVSVRKVGRDPRFSAPDDNIGIGLVSTGRFRLGPSLNLEDGRDEEDAIVGIGDVGRTVEGGAFAEAFLSDNVRLRGDVRKGFGGHKGVVADIGADAISGNPGGRFHVSAGPRLRLANARYVRSFFGVNANQSALTGLPVYDEVDGGLHSLGALSFMKYRLSQKLAVQAYGRYDRLMGDARNSPLVLSDVGSRNQYEAGLGLTYSFTIR